MNSPLLISKQCLAVAFTSFLYDQFNIFIFIFRQKTKFRPKKQNKPNELKKSTGCSQQSQGHCLLTHIDLICISCTVAT